MTEHTTLLPSGGRAYYIQPRPKTYDQVHHGLQWAFGSAAQHSCVACNAGAGIWAYQYSAGSEEQISAEGSPYSDNLNHYAPMCRRCHRIFDMQKDPERNTTCNFQPGGQRAIRALIEADPSWVAYRSKNMKTLNQRKVLCGSCSLKTNPGALARHQQATGHSS